MFRSVLQHRLFTVTVTGQGGELTVKKAKEQVQNLLSRSSDSQLLPKERSLARKHKTRNWA